MRFKIFFNEGEQKLDINCLNDNHTDIILPENPDQHVYYPIPNDLRSEIKEYLKDILDDNATDEINSIIGEIVELQQKRKQAIYNLREKLNPEIIQRCEIFKKENAEYFI